MFNRSNFDVSLAFIMVNSINNANNNDAPYCFIMWEKKNEMSISKLFLSVLQKYYRIRK